MGEAVMASSPKFPFVASIDDCRHSLYGKEVVVLAKSGTMRLVQIGARQMMVAAIHLRYERAA
jgi:hypothetical protein